MSPCFISPRLLSLLPISFAIFERLHTRHFREQILSRMLNKCGFSHQDTGELLLRGNISLQNYKKLCRKIFSRGSEAQYILEVCRPQGKFVNNAAARGEAAATYRKTVHELSSTSVEFLKMYGCVPLRQRGQNHVVTQQKFNVFHKLPLAVYTMK